MKSMSSRPTWAKYCLKKEYGSTHLYSQPRGAVWAEVDGFLENYSGLENEFQDHTNWPCLQNKKVNKKIKRKRSKKKKKLGRIWKILKDKPSVYSITLRSVLVTFLLLWQLINENRDLCLWLQRARIPSWQDSRAASIRPLSWGWELTSWSTSRRQREGIRGVSWAFETPKPARMIHLFQQGHTS